MDDSRTVQQQNQPENPSPAETESFFTDGTQAWPSQPPAPPPTKTLTGPPGQILIDLPGVGPVRLSAILRGAEPQPGDFPPALQAYIERDERDEQSALVIRLLFAAKRLAESRIRPAPARGPVPSGASCRECDEFWFGERHRHAKHCPVGDTLEVLGQLERQAAARTLPDATGFSDIF